MNSRRPLVLSITALFLLLTGAGAVSAGLISLHLTRQLADDEAQRVEALTCSELAALTLILHRQLTPGLIDALKARWALPNRSFRYRLYTGDGDDSGHESFGLPEIPSRLLEPTTSPLERCLGALPAEAADYLNQWFAPEVTLGEFTDAGGVRHTVASLRARPTYGSIRLDVASPLDSPAVARAGQLMRHQSLIWALVVALAALAGGIVHRRFRARVVALNEVFRRFQRGELDARPDAAADSSDEIGVLALQIGQKLDLLQQQVHAIERVSLEIAHEIARPLTGLVLETYNARRLTEEPHTRERLNRIYLQLGELGVVLNELLDFGRSTGLGGRHDIEFEPVSLSAALEQVLELQRPDAESKRIGLKVQIMPGVLVYGSATMLKVLMTNLVANAIKYTDRGHVGVSLRIKGRHFELSVEDTGPGLPKGVTARLTTPFYRASSAKDKQGHGLGLTLVQTIASRHGFLLRDPVNLNPGLRLSLSGPLIQSDS